MHKKGVKNSLIHGYFEFRSATIRTIWNYGVCSGYCYGSLYIMGQLSSTALHKGKLAMYHKYWDTRIAQADITMSLNFQLIVQAK